MRRRRLLHSAALGAATLVAGCTGEPVPGTDESPSPTDSPPGTLDSPTDSPADPTDSSTVSPSHGTDPDRSFTVRTFTVRNVECGTGGDSAEITVDGNAVVVTGSAGASDPCHSARLVKGRTSVTGGTLQVAVETYVPPENEDEACVQCLADVDYEATFAFDGEFPDRVEVSHDGDVIARTDV